MSITCFDFLAESESELVTRLESAHFKLEQKWKDVADDLTTGADDDETDGRRAKRIENFLEKFKKLWLDKDPGWYEGFAPGVPSTDNALESLHLRQV